MGRAAGFVRTQGLAEPDALDESTGDWLTEK